MTKQTPRFVGKTNSRFTSHSFYDPTLTKFNGAKTDGFLGKGDFLVQGSDDGGTFHLLFWNLHKIWLGYKNPWILTPLDSVDVAS